MGEMRDSDWSRQILLRSDWLLLTGATITTQVQFSEYHVNVTRVATQGCGSQEEWVTSYKLQYSDDGVYFQYYMEAGQNTEKVSITNTRGGGYCHIWTI